MIENFDLMINESVQQYKNLRDIHFSFEHVPREQLSILMETIKLSYYSMKIAVPCTYIYVCVYVFQSVSSSLCIKSTMRTAGKNGRKNYSWTSKIKMDTVRGWDFPSLISTVLKSFLEIRYCSQSSYTFSIFFPSFSFYIYILFSLLFSTIVTFSILSFISYRIFFPEEKCTWHNSL